MIQPKVWTDWDHRDESEWPCQGGHSVRVRFASGAEAIGPARNFDWFSRGHADWRRHINGFQILDRPNSEGDKA